IDPYFPLNRDNRSDVAGWLSRYENLSTFEAFVDGSRSAVRACASATRRSRMSASRDRKSTRLNSSHSQISYAVFCLKKKMKPRITEQSYRPRVSDRTMRYRLFKADTRHLLVGFRRPNGVVTTRTWNHSGEEKKVSRL